MNNILDDTINEKTSNLTKFDGAIVRILVSEDVMNSDSNAKKLKSAIEDNFDVLDIVCSDNEGPADIEVCVGDVHLGMSGDQLKTNGITTSKEVYSLIRKSKSDVEAVDRKLYEEIIDLLFDLSDEDVKKYEKFLDAYGLDNPDDVRKVKDDAKIKNMVKELRKRV